MTRIRLLPVPAAFTLELGHGQFAVGVLNPQPNRLTTFTADVGR